MPAVADAASALASLVALKGAALAAPLLLVAGAAAAALLLRRRKATGADAAAASGARRAPSSSSSASSTSSSPSSTSSSSPPALARAHALALALVLSALGALLLSHRRHRAPVPPPPPLQAPPPARRGERPALPFTFVPKYLNSSLSNTLAVPLDFYCTADDGSVGTCSPSWCATSKEIATATTTAGCSFTGPTAQNYQSSICKVAAKTCSVSSDARCTSAWLKATFGGHPEVLAAYCNDLYLVVMGTGNTGGSPNLDAIPFPPGGTDKCSGAACRTRAASVGAATSSFVMEKIPLTPNALLSTAAQNNNVNANVFPNGNKDGPGGYLTVGGAALGLPIAGQVGFTVTTQQIFPMFNNRGGFTPDQCEVDACNQHVGQGGGPP